MEGEHDPRALSDDEFDSMMRELEIAAGWMRDQMARKRLQRKAAGEVSQDQHLSDEH